MARNTLRCTLIIYLTFNLCTFIKWLAIQIPNNNCVSVVLSYVNFSPTYCDTISFLLYCYSKNPCVTVWYKCKLKLSCLFSYILQTLLLLRLSNKKNLLNIKKRMWAFSKLHVNRSVLYNQYEMYMLVIIFI